MLQVHRSSVLLSRHDRTVTSSRRGTLVLEALPAIILLTLCTMCAVNYTVVALKLQALQAAVTAGVRQAAAANLPGTQESAARSVMQPICDAHGIDLSTATLTFSTPAIPSNTLVVELEIGMDAAGVPDWLGTFGISWSGRKFNLKALSPIEN